MLHVVGDVPHDVDRLVLARVREICRAFPGAEEGDLQDRPLFHVKRRRFAIFNGASSPARPRWAGAGRSVHFLSDPAERDALRADPRFTPSPHHGDRGWLAMRIDVDTVDWQEVTELLESAHAQVIPRRA
jgi:predicted DNA-binding protein (MmcQ/YjbR family)